MTNARPARSVPCPECGRRFRCGPAASRGNCPHCRRRVAVPAARAGTPTGTDRRRRVPDSRGFRLRHAVVAAALAVPLAVSAAAFLSGGTRAADGPAVAATRTVPPSAPIPTPTPQPAPDGLESLVRELAEAARREPPRPAEPQAAAGSHAPRSADLVVRTVLVTGRKADGRAWDVGNGLPDLKVRVERLGPPGGSATTPPVFDTTFAVINAKTIRVSEGDTIRVTVLDQDIAADDMVGTYEKTITAATLAERRVTWAFAQVIALEIEFEP